MYGLWPFIVIHLILLFFQHCAHVVICESRSSANTSNIIPGITLDQISGGPAIREKLGADAQLIRYMCFVFVSFTWNSFCFINQLYSPLNYQILLEGILLKNKQATSLITRYLYPIRGLMQINKLFLCLILR